MNSPIDMLTVSTQLRKAGRLTAAGGSFYLTQCTDKVASAANLKYHTATIKELSIRRNLVTKLTRLNQQAGQITIDLDSILESTSSLIDDVLQNVANKAQILALKDNVAQYIDKVANDQKNIGQSDKKRLCPSIGSLAEFIPEWAPGELIVIAGRPGMAKTSVALDLASCHLKRCKVRWVTLICKFARLINCKGSFSHARPPGNNNQFPGCPLWDKFS